MSIESSGSMWTSTPTAEADETVGVSGSMWRSNHTAECHPERSEGSHHILAEAVARLAAAGVPDPKWDAEELLEWAGGPDRSHLIMMDLRDLPMEVLDRFEEGLSQRVKRIPLQQITGRTWFMGLPFYVNENVLCPRPDTEVLVERALALVKEKGWERSRILDLCCGSGCIGLSLAHYLPEARIILSDISPAALDVAKKNAAALGVTERCSFHLGDMGEGLTEEYDLVCCNPPYIPGEEIDGLMPEVKDHEPRLALDGGEDGLDHYRRLAGEPHPSRLRRATFPKGEGILLLEIGCEQGEAVREIFLKAGWNTVLIHKDYAGLDRVAEIIAVSS